MKEGTLVKAAIEWLYLHRCMAWRNNSGLIPISGQGKRRCMHLAPPGTSDILGCLPGGRLLAIECKIGRNKPTRLQQQFLNDVEAMGGRAVCIWSLDDLEESFAELL